MSTNMQVSEIHSNLLAAQCVPLKMTQDQAAMRGTIESLKSLGIDLSDGVDFQQTMDAIVNPLTNPSVILPVQFAQTWLPGFVETQTAARVIDTLIGRTTIGRWEDSEIVQPIIEFTGNARPYTDSANTPLANWNPTFETRTIQRFEDGMSVGVLEQKRSAQMRGDSSEFKRKAASQSLEIIRNRVGFNGYNTTDARTYGLLNDPSLPAYIMVEEGAANSTKLVDKTYKEQVKDFNTAASRLLTQSQQRVNPSKDPCVLVLAMSVLYDINQTADLNGYTTRRFLEDTYPNWRIESAPEFDKASGDNNVFYLYSEKVEESGTDDLQTFMQIVPSMFMTVGFEQRAKSRVESYSNGTAGTLCKRPYAVVRYEGV